MPQDIFRTYNYSIGLSKALETPYNQRIVTPTGYLRVLSDEEAPAIPKCGKVSSSTRAGSANEFDDGSDTRNDYWDATSFKIADDLNSEIAGILWQMALSGGITDSTVTVTTAFDHAFGMMLDSDNRNHQVLSRNGIVAVGSSNYLYTGMGVGEFGVNFEGDKLASFYAQMMGSGYHESFSAITPAITIPDLASQIPFRYMRANNALMQFTGTAADFGGLYTVSTSSRFRGLSFSYNNDLKFGGKERQMDDPSLGGDPKKGAYQNRLRHGLRSGKLQISLLLDSLGREKKAADNNSVLSNLEITFRGEKINATDFYEFSIVVPKFQIETVTSDVIDGDEVVRCDIKMLKDPLTKGFVKGRVRNGNAAGIIATA